MWIPPCLPLTQTTALKNGTTTQNSDALSILHVCAETRLLPTLLMEKNGSLNTKGKQTVSLYEIVYMKSEIKLQEKQEKLEYKLFPGHKNELN